MDNLAMIKEKTTQSSANSNRLPASLQNGATGSANSVWGAAGGTKRPLGNAPTLQQQQSHHPPTHTNASVWSSLGHASAPGSGLTSTGSSVWSSSHRAVSTMTPPLSSLSAASAASLGAEPLFPPLTLHPNLAAAPALASYSTLAKKTIEAIDESDFPPLSDAHTANVPLPLPSQPASVTPLAANVVVGHAPARTDRQHAQARAAHSQSDVYFASAGGQRKSSGLVQPPSGVSAAQPSLPGHSQRPDFALMGLLDVIRMTDPDLTTLALGIDLASLGLDLTSGEPLYMSFVSPWGDAHTRISQLIPPCYQMPQLPPPLLQRLSQISEDSLLYLFYSSPLQPSEKELARLAEIQEAVAKELSRRGWRWRRDIHQWLLRDTSTSSAAAATVPLSQPAPKLQNAAAAAPSLYTVFDPLRMEKTRRELVIPSDHLVSFWDERPATASASKTQEPAPNVK